MKQIADRYAHALFELAQEENSLYPVYVSLQEINKLIKEKEDLKLFIRNPLLSVDERAKVLTQLFENKVPKLLYKFLLFLNLKHRLNLIDSIFESFDEHYLAKNNQMRAHLETAFELDDQQKQALQKKLSEKYKKEITLETTINKDLLGGFRFISEGQLFDSSIKSQLEQFRQKVTI